MSDLLACRLTAPLPSAIATISVQGYQAYRAIASILQCNEAESFWTLGRIRFLKWPVLNDFEHVVVCRVDENKVEIHCHGGVAVSNAILQSLEQAGCKIVDASELAIAEQKQLGEQGTDSLSTSIERHCREALIQTLSERAAGVLLDQASGALHESLLRLISLIEQAAWAEARAHLNSLLRWNDLGMHLIEPWRVVLAGPPNVGKSSLINALSGQSIAIVHHEAGTTRDWIESTTMIDGWPVTLTDTAGIRDTDEQIEREGVRRAREQITQADLVVLVIDATIGWTSQHEQIIQLCDQRPNKVRLLVAWNKCDLNSNLNSDLDSCDLKQSSTLAVSKHLPMVRCSVPNNVASLVDAISKSLVPEAPKPGQAVAFVPHMLILLNEIASRLTTEVAQPVESELKLLAQKLRRC